MATTSSTEKRGTGFSKNQKSANQSYKDYVASMPDGQQPKPFKQWLSDEQLQGRYLYADKVTAHGWKKSPEETSAPEQPVMEPKPAEKITAKTATEAPPFVPVKVMGMHPALAFVVVVGVTVLIVQALD